MRTHVTLLLLLICSFASAQTDVLRKKIHDIISSRKAEVGVAISGNGGKDTLTVNGGKHMPMQSVFKFHIALVVLSHVDQRILSIDQKIKIDTSELLPGLYSPLREKYPKGATLPLAEILSYTVSLSDNVGCDALLKLLGGPQVVNDYFVKNNIKDISIRINEETMQNNWDRQFENWTTPKAANELLMTSFYNKRKLLSRDSYDFIWKLMKETQTGEDRLKGQLPKGTIVAHKTGYSGTNKHGITAAYNDMGVIFTANGQPFFISVFVTHSKENEAANAKIIADIAKAAWDYFSAK